MGKINKFIENIEVKAKQTFVRRFCTNNGDAREGMRWCYVEGEEPCAYFYINDKIKKIGGNYQLINGKLDDFKLGYACVKKEDGLIYFLEKTGEEFGEGYQTAERIFIKNQPKFGGGVIVSSTWGNGEKCTFIVNCRGQILVDDSVRLLGIKSLNAFYQRPERVKWIDPESFKDPVQQNQILQILKTSVDNGVAFSEESDEHLDIFFYFNQILQEVEFLIRRENSNIKKYLDSLYSEHK